MNAEETSRLAVFYEKQIREVFHGDEWWFSIIGVAEVPGGKIRGNFLLARAIMKRIKIYC